MRVVELVRIGKDCSLYHPSCGDVDWVDNTLVWGTGDDKGKPLVVDEAVLFSDEWEETIEAGNGDKSQEMTPLGKEMSDGLSRLCDVLKSGDFIEDHFVVRDVKKTAGDEIMDGLKEFSDAITSAKESGKPITDFVKIRDISLYRKED